MNKGQRKHNMSTTHTLKRIITGALLSGGIAVAGFGLAAGTAHADPIGPKHWCPGEQPVPKTGNHITDPLNWDWNVCHTYYIVLPGQGNVSSMIWDGDDPPGPPPSPPAIFHTQDECMRALGFICIFAPS
jgi:hypothetical protein